MPRRVQPVLAMAASESPAKKILKVVRAGHNDLLYLGYEEYMEAIKDLVDQVVAAQRQGE